MSGKILAFILLGTALVAGAAMYYLQVYAYYHDVPARGPEDVMLTPKGGGAPEPLDHAEFRAIDAESSPIRYRACFTTDARPDELEQTYEIYEGAEPRNAPFWFGCFDAEAIGEAMAEGTATVFTGERNREFGIDRVVAITRDGHGYVWHEVNACGDKSYDGSPLGEDCPKRPTD